MKIIKYIEDKDLNIGKLILSDVKLKSIEYKFHTHGVDNWLVFTFVDVNSNYETYEFYSGISRLLNDEQGKFLINKLYKTIISETKDYYDVDILNDLVNNAVSELSKE
jgi:hypothetical protein